MKMKNQLLVLTILLVTYYSEAYKILVVSPYPGKSHSILGRAVVRHLSNAGHEITYITAFPHEKPAAGVREIDVSCNNQCLSEPKINIESILKKEQDVHNLKFIAYVNTNVSSHALECEAVNKILTDPKETFDVIIAEWMFSELYATLAAVYQCPLIWLSSLEPHWRVLTLIDEIPNPSYNPDIITSNDLPLSFTQRLQELTSQIVGLVINYFYAYDLDETNYNKIIVPIIRSRGNPVPTFEELRYNASLMLGNSHISMGRATRLPPSYKSVGGYHIDENVKPLPADLKNILDNAKNGVIYFSMGSTLRSSMMPNELIQSLLKMFGGLKQIVLWKFEEDLPNRPSNVHILQWAPQLSILAHPNCRVFITHGGLLSTTEAIYFGKPLIVIPVFVDQFGNAERAVSKGFAVKVDLSYTMAGDIKSAINDIFTEPKYAAKAKALSLIYHDRLVPPGKELVHWVEHVVKTNGALHLRSPALHLPFYQKLYLDLLAIILIILYVIKVVIKMIFAKICGKKKVKVLDHKKKNK